MAVRKTSLFAIGCAAAALLSPGRAAAAPAVTEYVALGDSWAADATVTQATAADAPLGCYQSRRDYAKQIAAALAIPVLRDATCGGAKTADLTGAQGTLTGDNAPQFDRLTPSTDLVTLEIGGNDAGLAVAVQDCLTIDPTATPCQDRYVPGGVDRMSANIAATEPKVTAAVTGVRARAPHARILLIDYFEGVRTDRGCWPVVPISDVDAAWLGRKLVELDAMLARVAAATGVEFVDTYGDSGGHDACRPVGTRWVEGLIPLSGNPPGPAVPFHPNQLGADHQARSILAALAR
ncbi:SGNH/GDSL hydrolase family protein [Nocardia terpenica]|uniref:SGNH/GDSL hydrolase family protein n=1 Tax=Nocardia terpenica TaxID=455432 RepID=UPI0015C53BC1|nr:SGNH/GDSL hydrolase family protein [Nocardia terpenica]NQE90373.1 SGNH/GDSL hydrolase family protein [Nocardia terpenica]